MSYRLKIRKPYSKLVDGLRWGEHVVASAQENPNAFKYLASVENTLTRERGSSPFMVFGSQSKRQFVVIRNKKMHMQKRRETSRSDFFDVLLG